MTLDWTDLGLDPTWSSTIFKYVELLEDFPNHLSVARIRISGRTLDIFIKTFLYYAYVQHSELNTQVNK